MSLLKLSGYNVPAKPIITTASITSLIFACFGAITTVLGSITAALCMGADAHEAKDKRYIAGICNGLFYILGGLFAGSIVLLFSLFPKNWSLHWLVWHYSVQFQQPDRGHANRNQRESALITF